MTSFRRHPNRPPGSASGWPERPSMSWGSSASVSSTPSGAICRFRGASVRSGHGHLAQNLRHHTSSTIAPSRVRRTATPVSSRGMSSLPERVRLVIFDLDGVIYRGLEPIDGARELVAGLHAAGVAVRFATNNSMVAREGYVTRLEGMGIATTVEEIVTSTSATVEHLRRHAPDVRSVLAIGANGMEAELRDAGLS